MAIPLETLLLCCFFHQQMKLSTISMIQIRMCLYECLVYKLSAIKFEKFLS